MLIIVPFGLGVFAPFTRADDGRKAPTSAEQPLLAPAGKYMRKLLDRLHNEIERDFAYCTDTLDRRLSNNNSSSEETDESQLKLSLTTQYKDEEFKFSPAARLRLSLPMTERRFQIILDQFSDEDSAQGERDINERDDQGDKRTSVGMRFISISKTYIHQHVDVGFSLPSIIPFIRANASWSKPLGPWVPRLTGQLSWERDDSFGAKAILDARREVMPKVWFQSYSEASWLANVPGIKLVQDMSVHWLRTDYDSVSPLIEVVSRTHSYAFDDNSYEHPDTFVENIWFSVRYRRQIYKDWLFLELEPGFYYSRQFDFDFEPSFRLKIEGLFGAQGSRREDVSKELEPDR